MQIDIYSDVICPWCFIGKRRLERALAARPQPDLEVRWRPFQLNPDMPEGGMDRSVYLAAKFGGPERAKQIYAPIEEAGAGEGIAFRFDRIDRTPNTVRAHRLLEYAYDRGCQTELKEALLRAYFIEGDDIGDDRVLAALAELVGLDRKEALQFLASEQGKEHVIKEDQSVRAKGLNGVPCFIFNNQYVLMGAQPPEAFLQMFDLAREDEAMHGMVNAQSQRRPI